MKRWIGVTVCIALVCSSIFLGCSDSSDDSNLSGGDGDAESQGDEEGSGEQTFVYDNPVQKTSPWPMFRRDSKNRGRSPVLPTPSDKEPWKFSTGKGMFHAPVIGGDGTIYMGSADTNFYAISSEGKKLWSFPTGEILDSTAVIGEDGTLYVPAGDGNLYALTPDGEEKWRVQAGGGQFITWWEGHITMDRNGVLFAGNDDYHLYAISTEGEILWGHKTGDQVWSCASFGDHNEIFFGSNDAYMRVIQNDGSLDDDARLYNQYLTIGPVTSSPAVNDDGTLVVFGSFDGYVYGANPADISLFPKWSFPARDHIYGSAAIAEDGTIYIGSADGSLYALNQDGTKKWAFDTLDSIRSCPAIDGEGNVYFGAGDGRLYALNASGERLWSFDTSENDRNDLNGSPVIGFEGIYIGGEHGDLNFVPFGYCESHTDDTRCSMESAEDIPADGALLYFYTIGGSSVESMDTLVGTDYTLTYRLVVREAGDTLAARLDPDSLVVDPEPDFAFRTEISANGQFVNVIPTEDLTAGTDYSITLSGDYLTGGERTGNRFSGGTVSGNYSKTFYFSTAAASTATFPATIGDNLTDVLLMRRMAVPQPPMMTTFNQIGFDSYNFMLGLVAKDETNHTLTLLGIEGTPGLEPEILKGTKSIFVLNGSYEGEYLSLSSNGFSVEITDVSIVMDQFRMAGKLDADLAADEMNIYAEVTCSNIESFGSQLDMVGLCNPDSGKMIVNGTTMVKKHVGDEGRRPQGLTVQNVAFVSNAGSHGAFEATFAANTLPSEDHLAVLLVGPKDGNEFLGLQYGMNREQSANDDGSLHQVRLVLPKVLAAGEYRALVVVDLYPVHETTVQIAR